MIKQMNVYAIGKQIIYKLNEKGHIAYFAGGWVRDFLRGEISEEIDIATNASPEQICSLFEKTITVGISFGVVVVVIGGFHFEVATFRKDLDYADGRHPTGIETTNAQEDALRRDFTINGMFYNPFKEEVLDFVSGQKDLEQKIIRAIGNPHERFLEDRLRMIRAIRFAARFDFAIEPTTEKAICQEAQHLFPSVSIERIFQEFSKMIATRSFDKSLVKLEALGLLHQIFPTLKNEPVAPLVAPLVAPFAYFPKECPTIIYLIHLFPNDTPQNHLELCQKFKTSANDQKLVAFFDASSSLLSQTDTDPFDWAQFYAHESSTLFLKVQSAYLNESKKIEFEKTHVQRKKKLSAHIKRLVEKRPLVTAALLKEEGIKPGKKMGLLLKEGEKIAINRDLQKAQEVLATLKQLSIWKQ